MGFYWKLVAICYAVVIVVPFGSFILGLAIYGPLVYAPVISIGVLVFWKAKDRPSGRDEKKPLNNQRRAEIIQELVEVRIRDKQ